MVCDDAHEPLVSHDLFDRVQRMLRRGHKPSKSPTPGKYLLTGLIYLGDGQRLQGCSMSHAGRKVARRYDSLSPRSFEEFPDESDRPSFRADTIEQGVLAMLQAFIADERTKRAIRSEITRRTKKVEANVGRIESQMDALRAKIDRAPENLALANPEDIPGISKLLAGWRDQETQLRDKLRQARGDHAPSPEALEVIGRLDELLERLSEADREKLSFAIRQTVKRITLRRERRENGKHRITLWDGVIELRDDLGVSGMFPLSDDDIPTPGRWREAVAFIRERGVVVFFRDVALHVGLKGSCVSRLLAQAVLSGKVTDLGHQKGWIAAEEARDQLFDPFSPLERQSRLRRKIRVAGTPRIERAEKRTIVDAPLRFVFWRFASFRQPRSHRFADSDSMPLHLTYTGDTSVPVEIEGFTPDWAAGKSLADVERFEIFHGNRKIPLAEMFRIAGDASDGEFEFEGDLSGVHWIGAHMTSGTIRVRGPAGRHVGSQMRGGSIVVEGDARGWVGSEMRRGLIHVKGNAGHLVGAAYRGSAKGMTGGTILVDGSAGNEIGHTMRRGLIAVGGEAGDLPGFNMIAGTVLIFGKCGIRPGAGMRRGTLAILGPEPPAPLPSFRYGSTSQFQFLSILLRDLARRGFAFDSTLVTSEIDLYHGDLVSLGRGEILFRHQAS